MIPLIDLGSQERSWVPPLAGWALLTVVGAVAYGIKVGSFSSALFASPLVALMAGFAAFWPVASFLGAHSSKRPLRRLLLAIFAPVALVWSAWAIAEILSSESSTASIGLIFVLASQGLVFVGVYVVASILDWVLSLTDTAK